MPGIFRPSHLIPSAYAKLVPDSEDSSEIEGFSSDDETENVLRSCGTCSTFSNSRCTRRRASPLEISSSEHHEGSFSPRYSKPKVTRAWRGLDSMLHLVKGYNLSTYSFLLQTCNHFQQLWNLAHINRLLQPFSPLNGRAS